MFAYKRDRAGMQLPIAFAEDDHNEVTPRHQSSSSSSDESHLLRAPERPAPPTRIYSNRPPPLVWNR